MRIILLLYLSVQLVSAQKYKLETSLVTFFSSAPVEDIRAVNNKSNSLFDADKAEIAFSVPISEFQFEKSLMQEHFNEKYMESDKYPRAFFQSKISEFTKELPEQNVVAKGKLTIHGVTKEVEIPGVIKYSENKVEMFAKFMVRLEDYKIKIPTLLWRNIAEEVEVTVSFVYKPYEN